MILVLLQNVSLKRRVKVKLYRKIVLLENRSKFPYQTISVEKEGRFIFNILDLHVF